MVEKRKQKALISVRVTNKFKEDMEKIAEDKGMTLPDFVRYVLTDYKENMLFEETRAKLSDLERKLQNY